MRSTVSAFVSAIRVLFWCRLRGLHLPCKRRRDRLRKEGWCWQRCCRGSVHGAASVSRRSAGDSVDPTVAH